MRKLQIQIFEGGTSQEVINDFLAKLPHGAFKDWKQSESVIKGIDDIDIRWNVTISILYEVEG